MESEIEIDTWEELLNTDHLDPNLKEIYILKAEEDFKKGKELESIFYQIKALWKLFEERYFSFNALDNVKFNLKSICDDMNLWEKRNMKTNPLIQYALKELQAEKNNPECLIRAESDCVCWNFLNNVKAPKEGLETVMGICKELPIEWTILQLCKGFRPETNFTIYPKIHQNDAAVYLTVLKHIRSKELPTPICLRLVDSEQLEIFYKYGSLADRFKECITIDNRDCDSNEARAKYWEQLKSFDANLQDALEDLKKFVYPWNFLFNGRPKNTNDAEKMFLEIDRFCDLWKLKDRERVLLSLAAVSLKDLKEQTLVDICSNLSRSSAERIAMLKLMSDLHLQAIMTIEENEHYPCILVLDEHLDHLFWEELNIYQEFTRVNSLQCLWRLYQHHKDHIKKGYFLANITKGTCLLNPDGNLPKTEMRMKSFFEYWTPHWSLYVAIKPTPEIIYKEFLKESCYVYAGHGSGLQYVNGKHIAKHRIESVIFLFGCDSSRLHSNGLYSDLVGAHLYYHAAMCPTLIGTLMPGLDARMDCVAAEILSRWITPESMDILPWCDLDLVKWSKDGSVESKKGDNDMANITLNNRKNYQVASLCSIIARIHQRITEKKFYNTVPYICRGLPAWNSNVQDLPS